jgi:hypothetical protein
MNFKSIVMGNLLICAAIGAMEIDKEQLIGLDSNQIEKLMTLDEYCTQALVLLSQDAATKLKEKKRFFVSKQLAVATDLNMHMWKLPKDLLTKKVPGKSYTAAERIQEVCTRYEINLVDYLSSEK